MPTADTERCQWLLKLMLSIGKPVVLIGETGTSKTATIQQFLRTLDADATVRWGDGVKDMWICVSN